MKYLSMGCIADNVKCSICGAVSTEVEKFYKNALDKLTIEDILKWSISMDEVVEVFRGSNITVYQCGTKEAIVYGGSADWMAQRSDVTNHIMPWRIWHSSRALAEKKAMKMVVEDTREQGKS